MNLVSVSKSPRLGTGNEAVGVVGEKYTALTSELDGGQWSSSVRINPEKCAMASLW